MRRLVNHTEVSKSTKFCFDVFSFSALLSLEKAVVSMLALTYRLGSEQNFSATFGSPTDAVLGE